MAQYIDKSTLVAEIKRLIDCCYKICAGNLDFLQKSYPEYYYSIETYKEILSFINTLEVKEVDLEKELDMIIDSLNDDKYEHLSIRQQLSLIAIHFFELGLKAKEE